MIHSIPQEPTFKMKSIDYDSLVLTNRLKIGLVCVLREFQNVVPMDRLHPFQQ